MHMKRLTLFLASLFIILIVCSKDKPSQPPIQQGTLLLDQLSVSMVPGAGDTVTIRAEKSDGTRDSCTIDNSDPNVAMATLSDSTIEITGVDYGMANINISSSEGQNRTLPVQVYTPFNFDTGDLTVTFTDSFTFIWNDMPAFGSPDASFHDPVLPEGYRSLGSLGIPDWSDPNGRYAMMVVQANAGSDALAEPVGYELVWSCHPLFTIASFWTPVPPAGYVAMGTVVVLGLNPPPLDKVVCVREDLTIDAEAGTFIWSDAGTGMPTDLGCWRIDQPDTGPHEYCHLLSGTFIGWDLYDPPVFHPVMHVLRANLPMLAEAPNQNFMPRLTGFDTPPEETDPMMAKAMLVPCTIINDAAHGDNVAWQVANSPMYRLERQVYYKLMYHNYNQTSEMQTNSVLIRSGITTSESERIWNETEISLSVEAGLSFKAFSGKITATVSRRFGYETQVSVAELQEKEVSSSINTPPGKAAALWQKYNKYILLRHNGTTLEPVSSWEFGIDSYVTDEYPD